MKMFAVNKATHPIDHIIETGDCARYIKEVWDIPASVDQVTQFVTTLALKAREMTDGYFHSDHSSVSHIDIKSLKLKTEVLLGELNFKDKLKDECEAFNADFAQILEDGDFVKSYPWLSDVSPKQGLVTDQNHYDDLFKGHNIHESKSTFHRNIAPNYAAYDIEEQGRSATEVLFTRTLYHFTQICLVNNALAYKKEMRTFALANYRNVEDVPQELTWVHKTLEMAD